MGIYKWEWNSYDIKRSTHKRVLYIDDVIIGNEKVNFEIMKNFHAKKYPFYLQ
jgi:hypothetical protein